VALKRALDRIVSRHEALPHNVRDVEESRGSGLRPWKRAVSICRT